MGIRTSNFTLENGLTGKIYCPQQKKRLTEVFMGRWMRRWKDAPYPSPHWCEPDEYFIIEFNLTPHRLYGRAPRSSINRLLDTLNQAILRPAPEHSIPAPVKTYLWAFVYREKCCLFDEKPADVFIAAIIQKQSPEIIACCSLEQDG